MRPVLCIAGPTASGKSGIALQLAKAVNGEIINADALQVYSDIRILSARPSDAEMFDTPHHLGLAPVPDIDPALVAEIDIRIVKEGIVSVMEEARQLDPIGTASLLGQDPQRLTRLLSVVKQTGRTLQDWQSQTRAEIPKHFALGFVMMPPRELLYKRINERFEDMVDQGGMDEARQVYERYGENASVPMVKAIGLSHLLRHFKGELSYEEAIILAKRDTRRFAKRQMTWFRNQSADWEQLQGKTIEPILRAFNDWRPS